MNQTFEQRIQSIEAQLKEIRKELEESSARYRDKGWLNKGKDSPEAIYGIEEVI